MTPAGFRRIKRITTILLACSLLTACASDGLFDLRGVVRLNGEQVNMYERPYEYGRELLQQERYAAAIVAFQQALGDSGPSIATFNGLGIAYSEIGRAELGLRYFEQALQMEPENVTTLNNIGNAARRRGENELALRYLERAHARAKAQEQAPIERNLLALRGPAPAATPTTIARLVAEEPYGGPVNLARQPQRAAVLVERIDEQRVRLLTASAPKIPKPKPDIEDVIVCRSGIFNCGIEGNVPYQFSLSTII